MRTDRVIEVLEVRTVDPAEAQRPDVRQPGAVEVEPLVGARAGTGHHATR